ncbi:MAG: 3-deoxy-D-manno-octulosonic acid transferase [Blastocatellia bacterium]
MQIVYSALLTVAFVFLSPVFAWQAVFRRKYLGNLRQRLGFLPPECEAGADSEAGPTIWLHAVSVGEALSAVPLMSGLRKRFPGARMIISTTTMTGQAVARERIPEADGVCYFPFDWRFSVRRALNRVRPRVVILMESELWLNFLGECQAREIPVIVANGRISDRSFARSRRFGFFIRRLYAGVTRFAMQSAGDAERALSLGAPAGRVSVSGNLKYDIGNAGAAAASSEVERELAERFGLGTAPLIVAGSTHAGEEAVILAAFQQMQARPVRLLLAPRHPDRFDAVAELVVQAGLSLARRSRPGPNDRDARVILLDSIGELAAVYSLASVVFIGGSIAPIGGHNILEPAARARPILVGWHMHNFREITAEFLRWEALVQLQPAAGRELIEQLCAELASLLEDPARAERLGGNARRAIDENRGATDRTIALVAELLADSRGCD